MAVMGKGVERGWRTLSTDRLVRELAAGEHRSTRMKTIALSAFIRVNPRPETVSQRVPAGCGKALLCGRFAGETACAARSGGGAGIQPAEDFHAPVVRAAVKRRPTRWR
jgi:hypothetical protein